jgi:hypothetical protein
LFTSIAGPIEYSFDNVTYLTFYAGSTGVGFAPAYTYGANLGAWTPSGSQDIYFKYTIPAGAVANGKVIGVNLLANNDGSTVLGVLSDTLSNGYTDLTRSHTAIAAPPVPEPTTFAIASIGLGLAGAARMRKRAKKA